MSDSAKPSESLTLRLSPAATQRLQDRAAASGQELGQFVSELVEHFAETPKSILELSGPIYNHFLQSKMSNDELADELEHAKDEMRAERHAAGSKLVS